MQPELPTQKPMATVNFAPASAFVNMPVTRSSDDVGDCEVVIGNNTVQLDRTLPNRLDITVYGQARFIDTPDEIKIVVGAVTVDQGNADKAGPRSSASGPETGDTVPGPVLLTCPTGDQKCDQCMACCAAPARVQTHNAQDGTVKFIAVSEDITVVEVSGHRVRLTKVPGDIRIVVDSFTVRGQATPLPDGQPGFEIREARLVDPASE